MNVDDPSAVKLANSESAKVSAEVLARGVAPEGRQFFGELQLVNGHGVGAGLITISVEKTVP